jgi:hypothetical protein
MHNPDDRFEYVKENKQRHHHGVRPFRFGSKCTPIGWYLEFSSFRNYLDSVLGRKKADKSAVYIPHP